MKPIGKTKGKGLAFAEQCPCCSLWEANQPNRHREKQRAKKEIDEQVSEDEEQHDEVAKWKGIGLQNL